MNELPKACEKCEPFNGLWRETPDGMRRCACPRGIALVARQCAASAPAREAVPVISAESATGAVKALSGIPFFPAEEMVRTMIADEIRQMCRSREELMWLVRRMIRLYRKWPGIPDLRMVYCATHIPLDGVKPIGESEVYPDGPPSEAPAQQPLALPPAKRALMIEAALQVAVHPLPKPRPERKPVPPIDANFQGVTQSDIDAAVRANREARAVSELAGGVA